jgi:hypothetical protein
MAEKAAAVKAAPQVQTIDPVVLALQNQRNNSMNVAAQWEAQWLLLNQSHEELKKEVEALRAQLATAEKGVKGG